MKKTQRDWVVKQLKEKGSVTRNEALQVYISRLGAIICDLRKDGWEIDGTWVKTANGKDYSYSLTNRPTKRVSSVVVIGGKAVETFKNVPV
jgi:hypothetical protein